MAQPKNSKRPVSMQEHGIQAVMDRYTTYRKKGASPVRTLRATKKARCPVHRLPFVGKKTHQYGRFSFWDVPLSGGYIGGNVTGESLGYLYLKYLRDATKAGLDRDELMLAGNTLVQIVLAMSDRTATTEQEQDSLKGQIVGFLGLLGNWLCVGVERLGGSLDVMPTHHLLPNANKGLCFDERAYFAAMDGRDEL